MNKLDIDIVDSYEVPSCSTCIHYLGESKCKAFKDNIPFDIIYGLNDHINPFKGDNGIQYEKDEKLIENK
tara:strand:+ start:807 stop:1016 length:210 start_codon:yes stop_codon:yes gene_type:complete